MKDKIFLGISIVFLFITSVSTALNVYLYRKYKSVSTAGPVSSQIQTQPQSQAKSQSQTEIMLKKISELMELPPETPTIVTVTDRDKLQSQAFFRKAQNDDIVLIFEKARRVILYRPSTGKIIDVAPLAFNTPPAGTPGPSDTASPSAEQSGDNTLYIPKVTPTPSTAISSQP